MSYTYGDVTNCKVANGQTRSEYQCRLGYELIEQSIENNTSTFRLRLEVRSINSSYNTWGKNQTTKIEDTTLPSKSFDMRSTNSWQVFGEITVTRNHNNEGKYAVTKTGSFTTNASSGYSLKSGSASVYVSLPDIARASQPSCITYPNTTQNVGNIGGKFTIHMNRVSDSFTHTVRYAWGNKSGTIATGVTNNVEWTIPMDFCNNIGSAVSGTGTIYVDTYSGSNRIGTKSVNFTANVPSSVVPSINSVAISEANSNVGLGVYVQNKSRLRVVTNASGSYSSWITSCKITGIDNNTYWGTDITSGILTGSGTKTIKITVTDSRGRTASTTRTYNCINYSNPLISSFSAVRCNADGTENDDGENIKYSFKGTVSSIENKNTKIFKIGYKQSTASSFTYITIDNDGYSIDKSDVVIPDVTFSNNNSYEIQFLIQDKYITVTQSVPIGTGKVLINFHKSGKAMAIGKKSEAGDDEELLEIELPTIMKCLELFWKESDYGDKFKLLCDFNGTDDSNKFKLMGAVGGAGTDPDLYDLFTVSGKNGNAWLKGYLDIDNFITAKRGIFSMDTGNVGTPIGNSCLIIKKANNTEAPNNGVVLEFGNSTSWTGQLYIGDNATQGIYYNGWSNGVRGNWRRLADTPVVAYSNVSGTSGTVTLWANAGEYRNIKITYKNDDGQYNTTVLSCITSAQGDFFGTIIRKNSNNDNIMINSALFCVIGTTITISRNSQANIYFGGSSSNDTNKLYITKVELWN